MAYLHDGHAHFLMRPPRVVRNGHGGMRRVDWTDRLAAMGDTMLAT
jgi:hypothetical protein